MTAIAGQIVEPAGNLARLGPEAHSTLVRHQQATVTYQQGGPPVTDTIPADGTKNVCTLDSSSNAIDVTQFAYVTYILPASGGNTQLLCAREADWATVVSAADAVPLDFVHTTGVERYQLASGAAAGSSGFTGNCLVFPHGHEICEVVSTVVVADPTTPPTLAAATVSPATVLGAGTWTLAYVWNTGAGVTALSPPASVALTAGQAIDVSVPALPAGVTTADVYVIAYAP